MADGFIHGDFFVRIRLDYSPTGAAVILPTATSSAAVSQDPVFNVVEVAEDYDDPNTRVELLRRADRVSFVAEKFFPSTSGTLAALRDIVTATHADGSNFPSHLLLELTPAADGQSVRLEVKEVTPSKRVFSFEDGTMEAKKVAATTAAGGAGGGSAGGAPVLTALELRLGELEMQVKNLSTTLATTQTEVATLKDRPAGGGASAPAGGAGACSCSCADTRASVAELRQSVHALRDALSALTVRVDALPLATPRGGGGAANTNGTDSGTKPTANTGKFPYTTGIYRAGDEVRIKPGITSVKHGWGSLSAGYAKTGTVTSASAASVTINWPDQKGWMASPDDVEPVKLDLKPGDKVTLRPSVTAPRFGKGSLTLPYREIGTVKTAVEPAASGVGYRVTIDWPAQSGWAADMDELERAGPSAPAPAPAPVPGGYGGFKVGDRVMIKAGVTAAKYGWGSLSAGYKGVGEITSIDARPNTVCVKWPVQSSWTASTDELVLADGADVRGGFRVGDRVRVKESVTHAKYGFGALRAGYKEVGTITRFGGAANSVEVDFPAQSGWSADVSELEHAGAAAPTPAPAPATAFAVGSKVRVKASVAAPKYGWGSVKHGQVGTVTSLRGTTDLIVDFPSQKGWAAFKEDMEIVPGTGTGTGTGGPIKVGDRVRVKASVANPRFGWGSVSHADIGRVASITGSSMSVDFPSQKGWAADPAELEKVD